MAKPEFKIGDYFRREKVYDSGRTREVEVGILTSLCYADDDTLFNFYDLLNIKPPSPHDIHFHIKDNDIEKLTKIKTLKILQDKIDERSEAPHIVIPVKRAN